jgi:hypothetical protein
MYRVVAVAIVASVGVCGCASTQQSSDYLHTARSEKGAWGGGYEEPPTLTSSLFASDQAVLGDEAIRKILISRLELPDDAKVALIKFPGSHHGALRYYGSYYWRSEGYLKTQQKYIDTVSERLSASESVSEVVLLPSLLTPNDATIPVLREAAVRLQADLLLVYRVSSDIYQRSKLFAEDEVKAYSTCEAVLLDVRSGIIPFTTVVTKEAQADKEKRDLETAETMRRVESAAVMDSLDTVARKLVSFLESAQ